MNRLDTARRRFTDVCAALRQLEDLTWSVRRTRDDVRWAEHDRLLQSAQYSKKLAFEELREAQAAAGLPVRPRSKPVKL